MLPRMNTTIYLPATAERPVEPAPYLLTDADLIRLLRLDEAGGERPELTLRYYRQKGLLRATQVGRCNRYDLPEVVEFIGRLKQANPK